jgi:hypothetical protein
MGDIVVVENLGGLLAKARSAELGEPWRTLFVSFALVRRSSRRGQRMTTEQLLAVQSRLHRITKMPCAASADLVEIRAFLGTGRIIERSRPYRRCIGEH